MACIRRALQRANEMSPEHTTCRLADEIGLLYTVAALGSRAHSEDKTDTNPKLSSRDTLNTLLITSNQL
jgi:hypothetical protein